MLTFGSFGYHVASDVFARVDQWAAVFWVGENVPLSSVEREISTPSSKLVSYRFIDSMATHTAIHLPPRLRLVGIRFTPPEQSEETVEVAEPEENRGAIEDDGPQRPERPGTSGTDGNDVRVEREES